MSRQLKEVQTQRGQVKIFEEKGEAITGILTGKTGRTIGDEENQIDTLEVFSLDDDQLYLLPLSTVLKNKVDEIKKRSEGHAYVEIVYLGKKDGKSKTYHDYRVRFAEAEQAEIDQLLEFEETQGE